MLALLAALVAVHFAAAADDKDTPVAKPAADHAWQALFDGKTLNGWKVADFREKGKITVSNGELQISPGEPAAGIVKDGEQELAEHKISIRMEVRPCVPLGISTWKTGAALRNLRFRKLDLPS
jgi:hypothetical protein